MVHYAESFWQILTSTLEVMLTRKSIIKYIVVFIQWIKYIFCKSWHFVCEWLDYVTDDVMFYFQYLFANFLLHVRLTKNILHTFNIVYV